MLLPYTTLTYYGEAAGAMVDASTGSASASVKGWGRAEETVTGQGSILAAHVTGLKNSPMTTSGLGQIVTAYPRGMARPTLTVSIGARPSAEDIAQAVWGMDNGIETGWTPRQILRVMAAVMAGKTSIETGTNVVVSFRSINDARDTLTAEMSGSDRIHITTNA